MNIFNRNGLSSRFCRSCLRWRACFTARSVNCCTVELSVSRCWIYHTNSFIGGVKQQLASTGRERNNLPLSNQMGSKQRCSPNSFSSPLVHVFSAALLSRGRGVRAVMQLHHRFFRLRIWLKKLTVKSLYWPYNIRAAVILLNFFPHEGGQTLEVGPGGDVGSPSLGILRIYLDTVLSSLIKLGLRWAGVLDQGPPAGPFLTVSCSGSAVQAIQIWNSLTDFGSVVLLPEESGQGNLPLPPSQQSPRLFFWDTSCHARSGTESAIRWMWGSDLTWQ